jgi:hypothetical protein
MVRLTLIARVTDGLPLAEGLDTDKDPDIDAYKQQAKVRRLPGRTLALGALSTAARMAPDPLGSFRSAGSTPSCTPLPPRRRHCSSGYRPHP